MNLPLFVFTLLCSEVVSIPKAVKKVAQSKRSFPGQSFTAEPPPSIPVPPPSTSIAAA